PTTPVMPGPSVTLVRSGQNLNPWISSSFSRMPGPSAACSISSFLGNCASSMKCEPRSSSCFFSHLFPPPSACLLFAGLIAAPGTGGKRLSVQPHFRRNLSVVRGAFFLDDGIAELGAGGFLCNLLQLGFVVLVCGAAFGDEGLQEDAGGLEPAVEIERGDQRLERVRHNAWPGAPAVEFLAMAKTQIAAQVDLLRKAEQRF